MTNIDLISKINTEDGAEALAQLYIQAKTLQGKEDIEKHLTIDILKSAISDFSPKKRKNTYRLIGLLGNDSYLPLLQEALLCEATLFTIPSLLLALGALGDFETVNNYIPPVSENSTMDKHVAEISLAKKKVLQSLSKNDLSSIVKLKHSSTVLCFAPKGFNYILAEELRSLGFAVVQQKDSCRISTADLDLLFHSNCLTEALIPIKQNVDLNVESIVQALPDMPDEPYRIELRGFIKDRRKLINSLSARLNGINNPSSYAWELRIDCRGDSADLYWKPFRVIDNRFPWRKRTLPASINPSLAACIAAFAQKICPANNPTVLDPFCGSGSLLFSIESLMHCKSLMGVDKSSTAIECARENAQAGKSKAFFITKDILRFEAKKGFDLIISNMPFGMRVGTHDYNSVLYAKFLRKLPQLMSDGGIAVLYTMEYKLLQKCIDQTHGIRVRETFRTEAGGLLPWIFVIDKE